MRAFLFTTLSALGFSLLLSLVSCAQYPTRTVGPPPRKLVLLPTPKKDKALESYVVNGERYYPIPDSLGYVQTGKASWYGRKFHGRRTASGEVYDMFKKTAAHKTLPFGTYVKVVNLSNQKEVVVRINDRGPFAKGRIIDLSYTAAKEIGLVGPGVAKVKLIALGKEKGKFESPLGEKPVVEIKQLMSQGFTVQVGAFSARENALKLADRLLVVFDYVDVSVYKHWRKGTLYRVRVSKSKTMSQALRMEKKLVGMGFKEAFVVRL